jgi:hypothetical protein
VPNTGVRATDRESLKEAKRTKLELGDGKAENINHPENQSIKRATAPKGEASSSFQHSIITHTTDHE